MTEMGPSETNDEFVNRINKMPLPAMEQYEAGMQAVGHLVAGFWKALVAEDVPEEAATEITCAWVDTTFGHRGMNQ